MRIDCPCCGLRNASEFLYLGDATAKRPPDDEKEQEFWHSYIFRRKNPKGWHKERWQHVGGCRSIIEAERNTVTHEIRSTKLVGVWSEENLSGKQKTSTSRKKTASAGSKTKTTGKKPVAAKKKAKAKEEGGEA